MLISPLSGAAGRAARRLGGGDAVASGDRVALVTLALAAALAFCLHRPR